MPYINNGKTLNTDKLLYVSGLPGMPGTQGEAGPQGPQGPAGVGTEFTSTDIVVSINNGTLTSAGLSLSYLVNVSSPADRNIAGVDSIITPGGQLPTKQITNTGAFNITFLHQSGLATSQDRVSCPGGIDYILYPNKTTYLAYDYTAQNWVLTQDSSIVSFSSDTTTVTNDSTIASSSLSYSALVNISSASNVNCIGITASTVPGDMFPVKTIKNTGTFTITFIHQSGLASATNRLIIPNSVSYSLRPNTSVQATYDYTLQRWKLSEVATLGLQVIELAASPGITNGEVRYCNGYATADDGGGGAFAWGLGISAGADGRIKINSTGGQWQRVIQGYVDVKWFGAIGNGIANDTTAIQAAIAYAANNKVKLRISNGTYIVTSSLIIDKDLEIEGDGVSCVTINGGANTSLTIFDVNTGSTGSLVFSMRGLTIEGGGTHLHVHGTAFWSRVSCIEDVNFTGFARDGLLIEAPPIGASFYGLNFQAGTAAPGVKTYGIRAQGVFILHHCSWYGVRCGHYSGAGVRIDYTGSVGGTGSVGTTFHQLICEGPSGSTYARTADTANNSAVLASVSSTSLIEKGMMVTGSGITAGSYVVSISGSNVTISKPATATATGAALTFSSGFAVQLKSASVILSSDCYFEKNTAPDILVDTDYDGSGVTRARVVLENPKFDHEDVSGRQYDAEYKANLRILCLQHGVDLVVRSPNVNSPAGLSSMISMADKYISTVTVDDPTKKLIVREKFAIPVIYETRGFSGAGFVVADGGTPVPARVDVRAGNYGGTALIMAHGQFAGTGIQTRSALYVLRYVYDEVPAVPTFITGSGTDFVTFSFDTYARTGDTTNTSANITNLSSVTDLKKGMIISGTGIPVGTSILSISGTTITMSAPATATNTGVSLTFIGSELQFKATDNTQACVQVITTRSE